MEYEIFLTYMFSIFFKYVLKINFMYLLYNYFLKQVKIVPKKKFYFPVVKYCFQFFFFFFWRTKKCFKKQFLKRAFIIVWKILFIVSWAIILKSGLLSYHLLNGGSILPSTLPSGSFYIKWIMVRVRHLCPCMHEVTPRQYQ